MGATENAGPENEGAGHFISGSKVKMNKLYKYVKITLQQLR